MGPNRERWPLTKACHFHHDPEGACSHCMPEGFAHKCRIDEHVFSVRAERVMRTLDDRHAEARRLTNSGLIRPRSTVN